MDVAAPIGDTAETVTDFSSTGDAAKAGAAPPVTRRTATVVAMRGERMDVPFVGPVTVASTRSESATLDGWTRERYASRLCWPQTREGRYTMTRPTRFPLGATASSVSALVCAMPTLVFPADSPIAPKLGFLTVGAVFFALGVLRIRAEGRTPPVDGEGDVTRQ
ncbi:hypothetical protein DBR36_14025 [Microbacterium sp. HMWF026]|nr:hypothetical protein DBR36_14025 [Microbacterium sp. HMWF026]